MKTCFKCSRDAVQRYLVVKCTQSSTGSRTKERNINKKYSVCEDHKEEVLDALQILYFDRSLYEGYIKHKPEDSDE